MSAALTFDNFAFSYQAAAEAELLTERFAAQPNQDGRPLIGPLYAEIEEGSFTLITGATGCGKTTLLRCCKPELAPQRDPHGRDQNLRERFLHSERRRIGKHRWLRHAEPRQPAGMF